MAKKVTAIQSEDKIAVWELEKYFENISDISGWLFFCQWLSSIPLHFMYLLATPLSVIYASLDYAFTIRIDFTSTTAGLASLASYVQLTKPMFFFFQLFFPKSLSSYIRLLSLFIIYHSYFCLIISFGSSSPGRFFQLRLWNFNATELSDFRQSARM